MTLALAWSHPARASQLVARGCSEMETQREEKQRLTKRDGALEADRYRGPIEPRTWYRNGLTAHRKAADITR